MAIFKCKMCGGALNIEEGMTVCECEYCGSKQTVPAANDEKIAKLFERANRLRFNSEFDKAYSIYESIIVEDPEAAEAYWGLVLCKYGVEYVDDPATFDKVPTCHRSSFESVMDDENFEQVMETADPLARAVYREQAKQIEEIRKGIIEVSDKEKPYDIFICYKETAEDGQRTIDSVLAQDVYDALTAKGYRVFFSRITLEDKLGTEYEPYIFAALNSAKVMLAFGTSYDCYNAVWVKNEWSRYLKLMEKDKKKHLIPCYKDIDAYDIPKEFARLQAQDMGKVGAVQDLLRGIKKLIGTDEKKVDTSAERGTQAAANPNAASLLERAFMFLEDGDWTEADRYCDRVLDIEPKCAEAYLGKLMAELEVREQEQLRDQKEPFDQESNYQKVIRFGDESLKKTVAGYIEHIQIRNEKERLQGLYDEASRLYENASTPSDYETAAAAYDACVEFKDSAIKKAECLKQAGACRKQIEEEQKRNNEIADAIIAALCGSKKRKQIQALKDEQRKLRELYEHFSEFVSERENLSVQMTELKNKYSELKHIREHLGLFASKEKKAKDAEIAECEVAIETLQTKTKACESKFEGYTSEKEIQNRLTQIASEVSAIEAEIPKSTIEMTESEAEKEYFASKIIRDIVNKKEFSIGLSLTKGNDTVEFGSYPQSAAEKTAIEWKVLTKENGRILLISKYGLDRKPYNKKKEDVTWEKSSIRRWLNEEFMQAAFIGDEQKRIAEITLENPNNIEYGTKGGRKTQDKIFLLSIEEAEKYFASEETRACTPTNYAVGSGTFQEKETGNCYWWLRSSGFFQDNAAFIFADGEVNASGQDVDDYFTAVRPALWVNLES